MVKSSLAVFLPNQPWNENHQRVEALPIFTGTFFPRVGPPVCKLRNICVRSVGVAECQPKQRRVLNQISLTMEQPISKWLVVSSSWSECTGIIILYIVPLTALRCPTAIMEHQPNQKLALCICINWDQYIYIYGSYMNLFYFWIRV